MGNHDGKVVISTLLDNGGLKKGIGEIKGSLGGLKSATQSTSDSIQKAFAGGFSKSVAMAQARVKDLERQFETVSTQLKDAMLADDNAAAERAGNKQIRIYDQLEAAREKLRIAVEEEARKQANAEGKETNKAAKEQQKAAKVAKKNLNAVEKSAKRFGSRLREIVTGAFVFNLISSGLRSVTDYFGRALKTNAAFSTETAKLKAALLTAFQPIYNLAVPALTSLIRYLTAATQSAAQFFAALSGKTLKNSAEAAEKLYKEAEAIESVGSAAKNTGKALAGFDEINTLQNEGAQGGGSSASTTAPDFSSIEETEAPAAFEKFVQRQKDTGKQIAEAFAPSVSAWKDAFAGVAPVAENVCARVKTSVSDLWQNTMAPFGTYIGVDFIPSIANTYSETLAPIFADVMPVAMDVWTTDFENGCKLVDEYCGWLKEGFANVKKVFSDMCASISTSWDKHGGSLLKGFKDFKDGLWETWWYIYDNIIDPVLTACGDTFDWLWTDHLKPFWDDVVEFALSLADNIMALWNKSLKPVIDWLIAVLAPIVVNVINLIVDWVGYAVALIVDVVGGIIKILDGVIQFVVGVFTLDWKRAWGGIQKIFEGLWKGLSGIVKGVVNTIIWTINALIAAIYSGVAGVVNGLGSIVSKVGDLLGKNWGFSLPTKAPKIPYLAQGAVLPPNKPFMAVVGDQKNGTNIEAPLATIQEALANVLAAQGSGDITINFTGDLAQLARVLKPVIEKEGKRVGTGMVRKAGT